MPPRADLSAEPSDAGTRLDVYVARRLHSLTRSQVKRAIETGGVMVNGRPGKPGLKLKPGDLVSVEYEEEERPGLRAENVEVEVLFSDEHLAVLNKPSGLVVHPGAGHRTGTLAGGLLARFPEVAGIGPGERPGIVHRLDKETSGVMVVARSPEAYFSLQRMFKNRKVRKTYLGLVHGRLRRKEGRIEWAIGRRGGEGGAFSVRGRNPREALTLYKVVREYRDHTLVEIRPVTGRTHQIRVHFAAAGHPLAGDGRYGHQRARKAFPRLFLHAWRLAFTHPHSGAEVEFTSPLPSELEEILDSLGPGSPPENVP